DSAEGQRFTHVWSILPDAEIHPHLLGRDNVVFVRKGSPGYQQHLATAAFLINNSTFETHFAKREGQTFINTWHGIPWKTLGMDQKTERFEYGNIARNLLHADAILAPDNHTQK